MQLPILSNLVLVLVLVLAFALASFGAASPLHARDELPQCWKDCVNKQKDPPYKRTSDDVKDFCAATGQAHILGFALKHVVPCIQNECNGGSLNDVIARAVELRKNLC